MAKRHARKRRGGPRFPRKRWAAGQAPRVEPPAKGKASYRRSGGSGDTSEAVDEALEDRRRADGDA